MLKVLLLKFLSFATSIIIISSCVTNVNDNKSLLREASPEPLTVTSAPADGSISQIDPPAFVWLPVKNVSLYTLQYSRDEDFRSENTTSVSCSRTIYVPRQVLGNGKWYWRYTLNDSAGKSVSSRIRSFTINEDAAEVPFPDVKKVIANLQGLRPRDFLRTADLQRYRELG